MIMDYVYTYGDIIVSNYEFIKITDLKIERRINEHAKLYVKGIIDDNKGDMYVETANDESFIKVSIKDDKNNIKDLFQGLITNISINMLNDIRILEIEALSQTFLMDIKEKSRTFQDANSTYRDIINTVNSDYGNVQIVDDITSTSKIDTFVAQYKETDWEFIKRLASYFNTWIVPECQLEDIKYSIGRGGTFATYSLDEFNYSIKKELGEYKFKEAKGISGLDDMNLITYEVITNKILGLCDYITFKGRNLYVYEAEIQMHNSIISNKYKLRDENGMKIGRIYNNKIVGLSLSGTILDTKNDVVKVNLEMDGCQDSGTARWFPYSTVFSSEDGTGWYCMPEKGDAIRLYFPDNVEKNAYVMSSVNLKSRDTEKRGDPSVKSISTKYGKQLVMEPGAVNIIGGSGMMVKMTDDGGIEIISNKKIILDAQDDIEINGKAKVSISGDSGVDLTQNSANLSIKDDVTMSGGKVKIE
ncbi:phage tail protein [Clostridium botulinum]|uniref:phage tail protein n=1 Tax=unclassified Clostridium TaxID=2614128 RepID=UPI000C233317|nr:phage tail protein [Clostridium botulinum]MBY6778231.1 phage tail protein [Clostridium botulinum]MBY6803117.1 phage tail protein [Clostridium botulinum]MBY6813662.1 phage tail protein [Clostridium botulinum]MBY6820397.1 phage tail protein [Clostridium botulinum]